MARSTPKPKCFFKFMGPGFNHKLSIPPSFTESLNEKKVDQALIESCLGSWDVKVGRRADGVLYFGEGWRQFVKYHCLEVGNFLVFEHKGSMVFHVVVYESLGSEKEYPALMTPPRASTSSNPRSFEKLMTKTHCNQKKAYVTIPADFVRLNGLARRSTMILRDPIGRKWPVEIGTWQGRARNETSSLRTAIRTKGWNEFYAANKLKEGDLVTFVLQQKPKSRSDCVIFDVKIFCPGC